MIKSLNKINLLIITHLYGVLPDKPKLILMHYPEFQSEKQIIYALRTLTEKKYIQKIRILNYPHNSNHQKDAYLLTKEGKSQLKQYYCRTNQRLFPVSEDVKKRLYNKQYDMLCRLAEVQLFMGHNEYFLSRYEIQSMYPLELNKANKSLRYHGAFQAYNELLPIYNIKNRVMETQILEETKFFKTINNESVLSVKPFRKILICENEKVVDKLILNRFEETTHFAKSKENRYIFHPLRQNEKTYLFSLDKDPKDLLFFLRFANIYIEDFRNAFFIRNPQCKGFDYFQAKDSFGETFFVPMMFFELQEAYRFYASVCDLEHNKNKYVIISHESNKELFKYLFRENINVSMIGLPTNTIFNMIDSVKESAA